MDKVQEYYMSDAEESGEKQFNAFAEKHAHLFEGEFQASEHVENKLEYTQVYKEYQEMFEV
eukprot:CAMPEP_0170483254 /NCGR_PEP_ID=MMETSP0208-20121228/2955_1 /TAXON_ID=197538 /ORGANISM="Strombidium inclinatum, Strain S3" /LENGTH=60 /DNA_ID=CAMNT_0010756213 /DNA_START=54 /DNA_END=236 /DNA_ORIENTATION=-